MTYKKASEEFAFMRDKLRTIAGLLVKGEEGDIVEAAFMIGCLHNVCCENNIAFMEHK
jgi:hypothetical protein